MKNIFTLLLLLILSIENSYSYPGRPFSIEDLFIDAKINILKKIKKKFKKKRKPIKKVPTVYNSNHYLNEPTQDKHREVIDFISKVINDINNNPLFMEDFKFYSWPYDVKENLYHSQVYLIGENHSDYKGQLKNATFINMFVDNNSVILIEGCDRSHSSYNSSVRYEKYVLRQLYVTNKYNELFSHYNPDKKYEVATQLNSFFSEGLSKSYNNLNSLKSYNKKVYCWDSDYYLRKSSDHDPIKVAEYYLLMRNNSMIEEIRQHLSSKKKIFVIAGANHLPSGEFYSKYNINTTYEIQNFLRQEGVRYIELFPITTY